MSLGNLRDNGNKGNNYPWQLKMLMGMQCTCDELAAINANTDQVEFLLSAILTSLQEGTDYEAKFVVDTCDSDKVYLEVRIWDPTPAPGSWGPITYYIPGSSTPVVPTGAGTPGCLQYADPNSMLGMILAELQLQTPLLTSINTELTTGTLDVNITNPSLVTDNQSVFSTMIRDFADDLYIEVRIWDSSTNAWSGTPQYYAVGDNTAASGAVPVMPITYIDYQGDISLAAASINLGLNAISAKLGTLGQQTMANSAPVTIASNQSTLATYPLPASPVSGYTAAITGVVATDVIAAPGVGVTTYITQVLVTNSHATVGTLVTLQDDAGTALYSGYAAPAGGGFSISFPTPLKMPVANKKLQAVCGTTGSNVYVSACGYKI